MSDIQRDELLRLASAVPTTGADDEVILRPDGAHALAMLRRQGHPPRAFVLDAGAAVESLPHQDEGLPAAHLLAKTSRLRRALEPTVGEIADAQLVAWRPGKRAVVRVQRDAETLFVKFLDRKTFRRATATFAALPTAPLPLVFARPVHLLPEVCGYVAAGAPGVSLRELLQRPAPPPWPLLDAAARALAATPVHSGLPTIDFATARDAGVRSLQKGAVLQPELSALADRIAALPPPARAAVGFVHGDFHDRQLFLTADRAHLIDLEGVGRGDPWFDLVTLAEQARLRSLQHTGADDGVAAAMLDRLGVDPDAARRYAACVRARLCGTYALRPRWTDLTRRLAAEVDLLLAQP